MTSTIVVFGLLVVVVLVVVLVVLGLRAGKAGHDDDDWMDDDQPQPRGRRGAPAHDEMNGPDDYGYDDGGYGAPAPGPDRRVAGGGGPLAAPPGQHGPPPAQPPPSGPASDEMEDDDYWATITFDKPKFPWQHNQDGERGDGDMVGDPLNAQGSDDQYSDQYGDQQYGDQQYGDQQYGDQQYGDQYVEHDPQHSEHAMNQTVSLGHDGDGRGQQPPAPTGPQHAPGQQVPGGFQPFGGGDPAATALDPLPADLAGGGMQGGPGRQSRFGGAPDQPVYSQDAQPAYGAADPGYGGQEQQQPPFGGDRHYGGLEQPAAPAEQSPYGVPEQPQYGSDPLGTGNRPSPAAPPPGRPDAFDMPLGNTGPGSTGPNQGKAPSAPPPSDPLGLPLGRTDEPARGYGEHPPAPPPPPAPPQSPPPPPPPPPAPAAPVAPAAHGGSGPDTDNHKLPTVDELLQRIQTDRQRSAGPDTGGSSYGGGSANDPLATGSYGSEPGSSTGPWASGGGPGYDNGLGNTGNYPQGSPNDGYQPSPSYGDGNRYDDPLSGGGRDPYGGYGPESGSGGGPGAYGDFSGNSYSGSDPLSAPHDPVAQGGHDPNSTQSYDPGFSGRQGGYQGDDWENHRDYRR